MRLTSAFSSEPEQDGVLLHQRPGDLSDGVPERSCPCAAPLTGQADLYGPSYSSGRLAQQPPLYDRSIYMPRRPGTLPHQAPGLRPRQAVDLGLRRGYHTAASVSAV